MITELVHFIRLYKEKHIRISYFVKKSAGEKLLYGIIKIFDCLIIKFALKQRGEFSFALDTSFGASEHSSAACLTGPVQFFPLDPFLIGSFLSSRYGFQHILFSKRKRVSSDLFTWEVRTLMAASNPLFHHTGSNLTGLTEEVLIFG